MNMDTSSWLSSVLLALLFTVNSASSYRSASYRTRSGWINVGKTRLGSLPTKPTRDGFLYRIPNIIPMSASEILLHVYIQTGTLYMDSLADYELYTLEGRRRFSKYITIHMYPQMGWTYHSENIWLPYVRYNKYVRIRFSGPKPVGSINGWVHIIGYR